MGRRLGASLLLTACGLNACTPMGDPLAQSTPALNRVLRPLGMRGNKISSDAALVAVESANATYYFLLGLELAEKGKSAEAITAFERVRSLDPDAAQIHFLLARESLKLGRAKEGVAYARRALELEPAHRDAKLLLANMYATTKKYDEAYVLFVELQKLYPDDEEVMLYLALMEIEQKRLTDAHRRISTYLTRNPESALGLFYLGRLEQERGQIPAAMTAYRRALDVRPGFVQAGTYMAFLQEQTGDTAGARQSYEWLARQTEDANMYKKLGQLLLNEGQYPEALEALQSAQREEPNDLANRAKMGLVLLELKRPRDAVREFRKVLRKTPANESAQFYLAASLEADNHDNDAQREWNKLPVTSKLFAEAWKRRLANYGKQKDLRRGADMIQSALGKPHAALPASDVMENGVTFYETAEQRVKALELCQRAITELDDKSRDTFYYLQGTLLEKEGRKDDAVASMQKIIARNPDHPGALNFVGYVWAEQGQNLPQAERYIRRALKARPNDPFITDSLAWVAYRRGHFDEALRLLTAAQKLKPDEAVILDHLGDVLAKLKRFGEAERYYEQALKLAPINNADSKQLESKLNGLRAQLQSFCQSAAPDHVDCKRLRDAHRTPASNVR